MKPNMPSRGNDILIFSLNIFFLEELEISAHGAEGDDGREGDMPVREQG